MSSGSLATRKNVASAAALMLGVALIALAIQYPMGSLRVMGPGYLPVMVGCILVLLGGLLFFEKDDPEEAAVEPVPMRGPVSVLAGLVGFGLLIGTLGLVPAMLVLVGCCAFADRRFSIVFVVLLALALCAMIYLIFFVGLGLVIPLFRNELF